MRTPQPTNHLMSTSQLYKYLSITAFAAALMLVGMLLVSLFNNGVTAQDFELVNDVDIYARGIVAAELPLRLILTLDNLFIMFYAAAFIFLAMAVRDESNSLLVTIALGAVLITAYLDLLENHDILTQLTTALHGLPIALADLQERMVWSQLKFHSSYLGFFLFAFVLPGDTFLEKLLKISLWVGYPLIGILVYTFPHPVFDWLRYALMLSGLTILGWNYAMLVKRQT
ncbi:MAG: hypothetical protein U9R25_11915 [Chloroflexota bacterium]|nr:hypothetical protein [Chloroflexota bacterium]